MSDHANPFAHGDACEFCGRKFHPLDNVRGPMMANPFVTDYRLWHLRCWNLWLAPPMELAL